MTWVLGDWGTSRLRLFHCAGSDVLARCDGAGIGALHQSPQQTLRTAVRELCGPVVPSRIVLCGMAGSRNGLVETPYADCPADAAHWEAHAQTVQLDDAAVTVSAGLACVRSGATPDVLRGEETQIFGALQILPALQQGRCSLLLPGTHSKWVCVQDGRILDFHSVIAGELFALLRDHSTLARAGGDDSGDSEGFAAGLDTAREHTDLLPQLFVARSAQLRAGRTRGWALGYLSGLIIGSEVVQMLRLRPARAVMLIGDPALCARYQQALQALAVDTRVLDGDACVLAGLHAFAQRTA